MGWVSPTGYVDYNNIWVNELLAFDKEEPEPWDNGALADAFDDDYWLTDFIDFTHSGVVNCLKIRFYCHYQIALIDPYVNVDVYYDDEWHDVYEGTVTGNTWTEKDLDGSHTVSSVRFKFKKGGNYLITVCLVEVEFYQEVTIVTTQAATQISYQCAIGNGTITSDVNATERGFEVVVNYSGTLLDYFLHEIAGFVGDVTFVAAYLWEATMTKTETEEGDFAEGVYELVLGYPSASYDVWGTPDYFFDDKLFKCESYTYRAYAIIGGITYYGDYVAFSTLCDAGEEQQPTDDISEGDPTVPIIPIEPEIPIEPIIPEEEILEDLPYPPLEPLPPWEYPDYSPLSFIGEYYYHRPYTKKDLDELREKCIIYNKNSVEFAIVLRHNFNVMREFFNMMTDYLDTEEFNDFTDTIPPQRLKELYLDPLEVNDFRDMINEFIRSNINDNMAVNKNFGLIQEGLIDYESESDDAYFKNITTSVKTVTEDNPDVKTLKRVIDSLNEDVFSNYSTIMQNLEVLRARLL